MTNPIRDNLPGYLVGALEDNERTEVEDALASDVQLRRELDLLVLGLEPLAVDRGHYDPPPGLGLRACQYVYDRTELMPAALSSISSHEYVPYRRWTFADMAVAAGIFLAASFLFFPALNSSRLNSQLASCQNNLRMIGSALTSYSEWDKDGMFPVVPVSGKLATGGLYAPTLVSNGFIKEPQVFACGSDPRFKDGRGINIPTAEDLLAADGDELRVLQNSSGGSYGYTLGHFGEDGQYRGTKNLRRKDFALIADAPTEHCNGSDNHGGCGQNVLYEDGHVGYAKTCRANGADHLFVNSRNEVAPGLHLNDSVISGRSLDGQPKVQLINME